VLKLKDLFEEAIKKRSSLINNPNEEVYRLFNQRADGVDGLTLDFYKEYILLQDFGCGEGFFHSDEFHTALNFIDDYFRPTGILLKNRKKSTDDFSSTVLKGSLPPGDIVVRHNGISALADIVNSQNTGVFADMRNVRSAMLPYYEAGGTILNLFCYTGLFSVHALMNGGFSAINVDVSKSVLTRARENYVLNGLKVNDRDFIREDSKSAIKYLAKKNRVFDIVIFDPPTFSRSKASSFSVDTDYSDYLEKINLLITNGYCLSAINTAAVDRQSYMGKHPSHWKNIFLQNEPEDYPSADSSYLKVGLWKVDNR